jgi:hypothetical protein
MIDAEVVMNNHIPQAGGVDPYLVRMGGRGTLLKGRGMLHR